jgi:hypothetical protein
VHSIDTGSAESAGPGLSIATTGASADETGPVLVGFQVGSVVRRRPRLIRLPIGRCVHVQPVATTSNGLLDVPPDVDAAGWWEGGSRLGDPLGSMLLAAHVDLRSEGLGPFASLLTARPGERVRVWGGGLRRTYEIRTRRVRERGTITPTSWLHSPQGPARLTLVTSTGPCDPDDGGPQRLAVIVAFPIGEARWRR